MDFYCPELKLAIELDGGQHTQDDNQEYDVARSTYLKAHGINVMRFWNHEVLKNINGVLASIKEKITPPGIPLPGDVRRVLFQPSAGNAVAAIASACCLRYSASFCASCAS